MFAVSYYCIPADLQNLIDLCKKITQNLPSTQVFYSGIFSRTVTSHLPFFGYEICQPQMLQLQQVKPPWWSKNAGEEVLHGESGRNITDFTQTSLLRGEILSKFSIKVNIGLKVTGRIIQLPEEFLFVSYV